MSAHRILRRREWAEKHPPDFGLRAKKRRRALVMLGPHATTTDKIKAIAEVSDRTTFHDFMVASGYRHPSYQRRIRTARLDLGLPETASDMARVNGRRP